MTRLLAALPVLLVLPAYANMKSVPVNDGVGTVLAPSLFNGGPGLCFPAETAPKVVEAILAQRREKKLETEVAELRAAIAAKDVQVDALKVAVSKLEMANASLHLALDKQKTSTTELKKSVSSARWGWLWSGLGSITGGILVGYGACRLTGP